MKIYTVVLALLLAAPALAQDVVIPAQVAPHTVASLDVTTGAQGWVWASRYWAPPAEPKDLAGGRVQGQLGIGRWGLTAMGDVSGMPGSFDLQRVETFQTIEAHGAAHYNLFASNGIQLGVAVGAGIALPLEVQDGVRPTTAHPASVGAGLHLNGEDWWVYVMAGQVQALPGFGGMVKYQIAMSNRTAAVGSISVGAQQRYVVQMGIAVRWF